MTTHDFLFSQEAGSARLSLAAFGKTTEANERGAVCAASAIGIIGLDRKFGESSKKRDTEDELGGRARRRGEGTAWRGGRSVEQPVIWKGSSQPNVSAGSQRAW